MTTTLSKFAFSVLHKYLSDSSILLSDNACYDGWMQIQKIENRIIGVKQELLKIGEMRPGSLSKQYSACQKQGCKCVDPVNPKKHGPFHQLSYSHRGKSTTQFIRPQFVAEVRRQIMAYKKFRKLTDEWVTLSLELAKTKMEEARLAASKTPRTR